MNPTRVRFPPKCDTTGLGRFRPIADIWQWMQNPFMSDEWRAEVLETLPYLRGQSFIRKPYQAYRPGWEHDHCAVCGAKLMEECAGVEDTLHEGFAITAKYERGADYEWVCVECFEASRDAMEWQDETSP